MLEGMDTLELAARGIGPCDYVKWQAMNVARQLAGLTPLPIDAAERHGQGG